MNPEPPTSGASKSKKYFPWIILIVILCVPLFFVGSFLVMPAETIYKADEGFKKAKKTINPEGLRSWALEEIRNAGTNTFIPDPKVPKTLQDLYSIPPEFAEVNGNTIAVVWGGGFFHWKLDIGPTNFVSTPDEIYSRVFMWCPGIYYGRESTWGLW